MSNDANEAAAIRKALEPIIKQMIADNTKDCVRRKKAVVSTAYDSTTRKIGIRLGISDEIQLPCAAAARTATVGQSVIVEYSYGLTNGVVMYMGSIV